MIDEPIQDSVFIDVLIEPIETDTPPGDSVFADGVWNDDGTWDDTEVWKDGA